MNIPACLIHHVLLHRAFHLRLLQLPLLLTVQVGVLFHCKPCLDAVVHHLHTRLDQVDGNGTHNDDTIALLKCTSNRMRSSSRLLLYHGWRSCKAHQPRSREDHCTLPRLCFVVSHSCINPKHCQQRQCMFSGGGRADSCHHMACLMHPVELTFQANVPTECISNLDITDNNYIVPDETCLVSNSNWIVLVLCRSRKVCGPRGQSRSLAEWVR